MDGGRGYLSSLLIASIVIASFVAACGAAAAAEGVTKPKKGRSCPIIANTFGYVPDQAKRFLYKGTETSFEVLEEATGRVAYTGPLSPAQGADLMMADLREGDMTPLKTPGRYVIRVGQYESWPFKIDADTLNELVWNGVDYLQQVRAGDGVTGFRAWTHNVSHLDDGRVGGDLPNREGIDGEWFDLVGGWYDATDVRYWTSTWMSLEFVQQVAERVRPQWYDDMLLNELKHGNTLFLKSVLPSGEVLNPLKSENYWTDNIIGTNDDRIVSEGIQGWDHAYQLAYYELSLARLYKAVDPAYARVMESAGRRIVRNMAQGQTGMGAADRGMKTLAYLEMHRSTGETAWLDMAKEEGRGILDLQENSFIGGQTEVKGFFHESPGSGKTPDIRAHEAVFLFALLELARVDAGNPAWLDALVPYCRDFLLPLSKRNPYHLVPARVFTGEVKASRRLGDSGLYYRYFRPEGDSGNATGINPSLLSNAAILMEVGKMKSDPELTRLGWEQINYVLGMNKSNASTIEGAGNVPNKFPGGQGVVDSFPRIPGAVLNGMATRAKDEPFMDNGWEAAEYWMPQFGMLGRFLAAAGAGPSATNFGSLPRTAVLKAGRQQRFTLEGFITARKDTVWSVNGIPGGDDTLGTITPEGIYTAPSQVPSEAKAPKGILTVTATDPFGKELGQSRVRVIPEPGTPIVTMTRDKGHITLKWSPVPNADTYNVEIMEPIEGFYRIRLNTVDTSAKLPLERVKGRSVRVTAVNHGLGYGRPGQAFAVK